MNQHEDAKLTVGVAFIGFMIGAPLGFLLGVVLTLLLKS